MTFGVGMPIWGPCFPSLFTISHSKDAGEQTDFGGYVEKLLLLHGESVRRWMTK